MARPRLMEHINVVAVHDVDLKETLRRLGIYDHLANGSMVCMICEEKVSLDNLGALMRVNGKIKVICDKPSCFSTAVKIGSVLKK
ncbi:MAG: hypothetical protein QW323_02000 [Candidatus Bathyarchaeia archaeon]